MKKIFTLLVSVCAATMTMAQAPSGVIAKASVAPVIDGVVDDVWAEANVYNIDKPFKAEVPTLGTSGETTWQALWATEGVYVLVKVTDDAFYTNYMATPASPNNWEYDKPELYFNVNYILKNHLGGGSLGHYQVAPGFTDGKNDGTPITTTEGVVGVVYAFMVDGPNYIAEYFIPFSKLMNNEGVQVDLTSPMGFDVTVIDSDPSGTKRQRAVWANIGAIDESNNNMDDLGEVTFQGAEAAITIDAITLNTGGTITTDNGTFQMVANILPADATNTNLKWSVVNSTGRASVDNKGLVKGIANGIVTIVAIAPDAMQAEARMDVVISGQIVKTDEISILKNGNFDQGIDFKENWGGTGVVDGEGYYSVVCVPKVETPTDKAQIWDIMFGQKVKVADATTKYFVRFKAKATADMTVPVLFEDRGNSNNKTLTTSSAYRDNDYGKWDVPVTTAAQWLDFDVTFTNKLDVSEYELNFQIGKNDGTFSVDSIQMYSADDLALVGTSSKTITSNQLSVYPNPVVNELTVNMTASNVNVSIYNAVGQKMMEKVSTGTIAKFNVSSLTKGMYFVRLSDGTSQKFIK